MNWQTQWSEQSDKEFETSDFHQDTWNRYLMAGVDSGLYSFERYIESGGMKVI